jgi:hypothetical protein
VSVKTRRRPPLLFSVKFKMALQIMAALLSTVSGGTAFGPLPG